MDILKYKNQIILIIISTLLLIMSNIRIPVIDSQADNYFNKTIVKATSAYAVTRALNATVSIIKESTISLEPGGVGISLAAGQILDPIDDMTERLSNVLVTSIVSLGIQKLFHQMMIVLTPKLLAIMLLTITLLSFFPHTILISIGIIAKKISIILILVRLFLPLSTYVNGALYSNFFKHKIEIAHDQLALRSVALKTIADNSKQKSQSFWERMKGNIQYAKQKGEQLSNTMQELLVTMETSIHNLLELTLVYIGIFIFQVVLLPLFFVWLIYKLVPFSFHYISQKENHLLGEN